MTSCGTQGSHRIRGKGRRKSIVATDEQPCLRTKTYREHRRPIHFIRTSGQHSVHLVAAELVSALAQQRQRQALPLPGTGTNQPKTVLFVIPSLRGIPREAVLRPPDTSVLAAPGDSSQARNDNQGDALLDVEHASASWRPEAVGTHVQANRLRVPATPISRAGKRSGRGCPN